MTNQFDASRPLAPSDILKCLLQIPDSERALLSVLSVVQGLITQHPVLTELLRVSHAQLAQVISDLETATTEKISLLQLTKEKGLCSERPVYALLVEAVHSLKELPQNAWSMVAVALEFILSHREQFDEHPNRLVEFSKSLRQLMVMRDPIVLLGRETYTGYRQLASAMNKLAANPQLTSTDQRYAKYVETTLSTDWKQLTRGHGPRRKSTGGGRRQRPTSKPVVASDEVDVAVIGLPELRAIDGVLAVSEIPEPVVLLEVQPDLKWGRNRLAPDVIADRGIANVHAIRITQRLVQASNRSLLSTTVLQPDELAILLNALLNRKLEDTDEMNCHLAILLTLWTGVKLEQLLLWQLNGDGDGLIQQGDHWFTQCIIEPVLLNDIRQKVVLSCPVNIGQLAGALSSERHDKQLFTISEPAELTQKVQSWLARISKRHGLSIGLDRVQNFLASRLQCSPTSDPIFQRLAFGVERFQYRVQRYYTQMTGEQIALGISSIWQQCQEEMGEPNSLDEDFCRIHAQDDAGTFGSQRSGTLDQQRKLVFDLLQSCQEFSHQQVTRNFQTLVRYHNKYVEYTALMLLTGLGCRAVKNPFPSLALAFDALLFVCDKDDVAVATRLVSLCPMVLQQIDFYREHLNALANRIAAIAPQIAEHNQLVTKADAKDLGTIERLIKLKSAVGPLFYLSGEADFVKVSQLDPAKLNKRTKAFGLEVNFGRHHLRSQLLKQGVHNELVNQMLGHWSIGESPFSQLSELSPYDSEKRLRSALSTIMEEQRWKSVRSLLA